MRLYGALLLLGLLFPSLSNATLKLDISAKQQLIIAQSRGIATLPFIVRNNDTVAHDFIEELDLPEGWRLLSGLTPFHLAAGESQVRLVHIVSPSQTASGKYKIPYYVIARDSSHLREETLVSLLIPSSSKLKISILEKPEFVIAGEKYSVKLQVKNKGNTPLNLNIKVKDKKQFTSSKSNSKLHLKPSQVKEIELLIKTSANTKKSFFHEILVSLSSGKLQFDKVIKTQIITRIPKGIGQYKTIPAKVKFDYFSSRAYSKLQSELSIRGTLDDNNQHTIDILARNNQTNALSSLGSDSEYRASYKNNNYSIHLGDKSYYLEGITAPYFYGQGLELEYHPSNKPWVFKTYTSEERVASNNRKKESIKAAELSYTIADELVLSTNIAQRSSDELSQENAENMIGVKLDWRKYHFYELAISYAKDNDAQAYRIEQSGQIGSFYYDIDIQNADTKFDGRISDSKREELTAIYRFNNDKNYIKGSSQRYRNNLDKDLSKQIRQQETNRIGIGHYFSGNHQNQLFLELRHTSDKDKRVNSQLDTNEKSVRIEYQSNKGNWNINAALEEIWLDDAIEKTQQRSTKKSISLAYTPSENLRLGLNIEDNNSSSGNNNQISYGINAHYQIGEHHNLSGYWRHYDNDYIKVNYNYQFRNGISLGLAASSETQTTNTQGDTTYRVNLTIPFDAPIYKRKNIGSVTGHIIDKKTGTPVKNAVIQVDKYYAVSDELGKYQFPNLKEGKNKININLSQSSFPNYLLDEQNTKADELIIRANHSIQHNIKLLPGTSLEGQVIQYQAATGSILKSKNSALQPSGGIDGLLITLTNLIDSKKQYKQLTAQDGFFKFIGIPAGHWVVQVSDPDNLLGNLRIEEIRKEIQLSLENTQQLTFKAIPYVQKIKKIGPTNGFSVSGE